MSMRAEDQVGNALLRMYADEASPHDIRLIIRMLLTDENFRGRCSSLRALFGKGTHEVLADSLITIIFTEHAPGVPCATEPEERWDLHPRFIHLTGLHKSTPWGEHLHLNFVNNTGKVNSATASVYAQRVMEAVEDIGGCRDRYVVRPMHHEVPTASGRTIKAFRP